MNEHLRLLNGLIGFASSVEGWPRPLQKQGYVLYWVGPSYLVSNGKKSNPDLLFVSQMLNHSLIFECKSGVSIDDKQLKALAATTINNLIQSAQVSFSDPQNANFDIVIVCSSEKLQVLSNTLDKGNYNFPLLVVDYGGYVHLDHSSLRVEPLSTILSNGFEFDNDLWPLEFIPYDETSDVAEIASIIIPKVVSLIMKSGKPHFDTDEIIRNSCPVYETLHPREKNELIKKVRSILQSARRSEFNGLITPMPGGAQYKDKWIVSNTIKVGNIDRKVGSRSLKKRASEFISRLKKGTNFTGFKEDLESWQYEWDI